MDGIRLREERRLREKESYEREMVKGRGNVVGGTGWKNDKVLGE